MAQINPEDLILVNRDGVDYQAKVEDLPDGGTHWDDIEGKPCVKECQDCLDCLEAECTYIGTKDPQELIDWLGNNDGYGYVDQCVELYKNYEDPQDIFDIYIPDGDKNPFCINAFDRCFVGSPSHVHYRLADGSEGTFQTEIRQRVVFPDGRAHVRVIPIEKNILPTDEAFEVWIDIDEEPDTLTCQHPDHDDWVYWDNVVGVPEDLRDQEERLPGLQRVFDLNDDDLILISRRQYSWPYKRRDFAIEARHAKSYFDGSVPEYNDGRPRIHIINGPTRLTLLTYHSVQDLHQWSTRGDYLGKSKYIEANAEVIVGCNDDISDIFQMNKTATFAIGSKTDTSKVRIWNDAFYQCKAWDGAGAEYLNFSSAEDLRGAFKYCEAFNGDVSGYDVSNVTDMAYMFYQCKVFDGDISNWDVSNVQNFECVLRDCEVFNQDIRGWDTAKATNMYRMLLNTSDAFKASDNSDLSQWCVPLIEESERYPSPDDSWKEVKGEPVWGTCPSGDRTQDWINITTALVDPATNLGPEIEDRMRILEVKEKEQAE